MKIRIEIRSDTGILEEIFEKEDLDWYSAMKWFKRLSRLFTKRITSV